MNSAAISCDQPIILLNIPVKAIKKLFLTANHLMPRDDLRHQKSYAY